MALPEPLEDPRVGPILPSHFFEATTTQAGPPRHVTEATVSHLSSMKKSPLLLKLFNEMTKYYPDVIGGSRYGEPIARFLKPIAHCRSLQL